VINTRFPVKFVISTPASLPTVSSGCIGQKDGAGKREIARERQQPTVGLNPEAVRFPLSSSARTSSRSPEGQDARARFA
jgi:hypothetical protein